MPRYEVDFDGLQRVHMQNVAGYQHVPVKVSEVTQKIEVDFGLCESNGVCMGIIPEVFDLDDEDYLHVLQDEVTPENEQQVKEAVRQCPRQAIIASDRRMTGLSKLVFDPFSEEFFNGPWEIYRRMREEAPVYYNEEHDFYALSRHEDVAAAYKDFETYSSAYGLDLATVRIRRTDDGEDDHRHGSARTPADAQPGQQGLHPAGHRSHAAHGDRDHRPLHLDEPIPNGSTSYRTSPPSSRFK